MALAFKVGDRVRSKACPGWGIGIIEDIRDVDPDLSEAEQSQELCLSVVFPATWVPLLLGGYEHMYDFFARDEIEPAEEGPGD